MNGQAGTAALFYKGMITVNEVCKEFKMSAEHKKETGIQISVTLAADKVSFACRPD